MNQLTNISWKNVNKPKFLGGLWKNITKPKFAGGLGIRSTASINACRFMVKSKWNLVHDKDSLTSIIYKA